MTFRFCSYCILFSYVFFLKILFLQFKKNIIYLCFSIIQFKCCYAVKMDIIQKINNKYSLFLDIKEYNDIIDILESLFLNDQLSCEEKAALVM